MNEVEAGPWADVQYKPINIFMRGHNLLIIPALIMFLSVNLYHEYCLLTSNIIAQGYTDNNNGRIGT